MKTKLQELQDLRDDLAYLKVELISLCKSMKLTEVVQILCSDVPLNALDSRETELRLGDGKNFFLSIYLEPDTLKPKYTYIYALLGEGGRKDPKKKIIYFAKYGGVKVFRPGSWVKDLLKAAEDKKLLQQPDLAGSPDNEELSADEERNTQMLINKLLKEKANWEPFDFPIEPEEET